MQLQFWNFFASGSGKKAAVVAAALTAALTAAALVRAHKKRKYEQQQQQMEALCKQVDSAFENAFENRFLKEYDAMADDPDAPVPPSHANVRETTPQGDVIMTYDAERRAFCYYSDTRSVQFKFLESVARKYVLEHGCKRLHVDIRKATQVKATEQVKATQVKATQVKATEQVKDSVFAQFKKYRTQIQPQGNRNQQPQGNRDQQPQQPQGNRNQQPQQPQGNRDQQPQGNRDQHVQKEVSRYLHCGNLDEFAAAAVAAAAQEHDFSVIKPIDYASYKKMSTT